MGENFYPPPAGAALPQGGENFSTLPTASGPPRPRRGILFSAQYKDSAPVGKCLRQQTKGVFWLFRFFERMALYFFNPPRRFAPPRPRRGIKIRGENFSTLPTASGPPRPRRGIKIGGENLYICLDYFYFITK